MLEKIKSVVLYAGLTKDEFKKLEKTFFASNRENLTLYSLFVMLLYLALAVISGLGSSFTTVNVIGYSLTALSMGTIFAVCLVLRKKHSEEVLPVRILDFAFTAVLYIESIYVTIEHPALPAVTYIAVLLVLPLLFIDRPIQIIFQQIFFVALFCLYTVCFKTPDIAYVDIWNSITFLFASIAEILVMITMRVTMIRKTGEVTFISEHDLLTGLKNRNAYERYLDEINREQAPGIICVYGDVNGLHEMNNTKGHEAGDIMLQTVATGLREAFGSDDTYRIGGDEFAAFSMETEEKVHEKIERMCEDFCAQNYNVSFGQETRNQREDIRDTLKRAEQKMFEAKDIYYAQSGVKRRR